MVLTTGTFLRGEIHLGEERWPAGRAGDRASIGLAKSLLRRGLRLGRLKTGTPPRLSGRTIDRAGLQLQAGDEPPVAFSFLTERLSNPQVPCWITHTNARTHAVIRANLHRSPMHSGQIEATGVRYCPSIEDKVVRFADRERHQIFLEPEGLEDDTVYPNGISTSLPREVQTELVRTIPGWSGRRCCGPATPSSTTTWTRASSTRRSSCGRCAACSWRARSTARQATRRPRPRASSPG